MMAIGLDEKRPGGLSLGVLGALFSRGAGSVLVFLQLILIGRVFGPFGVGVYSVFFYWMNLLSTVTSNGLPLYLLDRTAALATTDEHDDSRSILFACLLVSGSLSVILLVAATIWTSQISTLLLGDNRLPSLGVLIGLSSAAFSMIRITAEGLKGQGYASRGLALQFTWIPAVLTVALGFVLIFPSSSISIGFVLVGFTFVAAALVPYGVASFARGTSPGSVRDALRSAVGIFKDRYEIATFGGILLINPLLNAAPFLIFPLFSGTATIGRFSAAYRLAGISGMILISLAAFYAPVFKEHYLESDQDALMQTYRRSRAYAVAFYLPLVLVFVFLPRFPLSLFGTGFETGATFLIILSLGRLIHACAGPSDYLLNMTGRSHLELLGGVISLGFFLVGAVLLAPKFGPLAVVTTYAAAYAIKGIYSLIIIHLGRGFWLGT